MKNDTKFESSSEVYKCIVVSSRRGLFLYASAAVGYTVQILKCNNCQKLSCTLRNILYQ